MTGRPAVAPRRSAPLAPVHPYPLGGVRLEAGVWHRRQVTNSAASLRAGLRQLEAAGTIDNFAHVAQHVAAPHGHADATDSDVKNFVDSDVYKWLEAVAWASVAHEPPADVRAAADRVVGLVLAAQDEDGYLNTWYQTQDRSQRFSNLAFGHELYCLGHLVQAAVAWQRARGDGRLLGAARRFADLAVRVFGASPLVCGHPEVEMALVELSRETGDDSYAELARTLIDRRGHGLLGPGRFGAAYYQDDQPYREMTTLSGHAVRAVYLAAGAVDVAVELDEAELLDASWRQWLAVVARRSHVSGGIGSHHLGESFGEDWELPPDRAYAETCAAIGMVMWSWRLLLTRRDGRLADHIERTVYNAVLSGVSLDGTSFHYTNPLDVHRAHPREPWFEIACCPPNVMRTVALLDQLVATHDGNGIAIHQYATARLDDGAGRVVRMDTAYPADGRVDVTVLESTGRWAVALRCPGWATTAEVSVNGEPVDAAPGADGYVELTRTWRTGDVVTLVLPMQVRTDRPDVRIPALRGAAALERGPLVYTLEGDDDALARTSLTLSGAAGAVAVPGLDPDMPGLRVRAGRSTGVPDAGWPYGAQAAPTEVRPAEVGLVPFALTGHAGPRAMRTWLALEDDRT